MTATGHAVIGTIIAAKIGNPALAIPLAVLSHIAADAFPHWDPGTNRDKKSHNRFVFEGFADVFFSILVTILIVFFLFPGTSLIYAFIIVFAAQGFDWLSMPYLFFKIKNPPIFYYTYKLQKMFDNRLDKPWGIIGQIGVLIVLVVLFKLI